MGYNPPLKSKQASKTTSRASKPTAPQPRRNKDTPTLTPTPGRAPVAPNRRAPAIRPEDTNETPRAGVPAPGTAPINNVNSQVPRAASDTDRNPAGEEDAVSDLDGNNLEKMKGELSK